MRISLALAVTSLSAVVLSAPLAEEQFSFDGEERRLIKTAPHKQQWMSESEIDTLIQNGKHFMDITDHQDMGNDEGLVDASLSSIAIPTELKATKTVKPLFESIDMARMKSFLTKFSSFQNRYYKSYGEESAKYLLSLLEGIAASSKHNITVKPFAHKWAQFSIIARFEPTEEDNVCNGVSSDQCEMVIVTAHQDSINSFSRLEGRAPGADDDGSGTTSLLEAFRVLAASDVAIKRPLEFHWYSAEEVGLLGSQDVAFNYKNTGKKVVAMMQNDMTGFVDEKSRSKNDPHIGLISDWVDPEVTQFLQLLIKEYNTIPAVLSKCGYACSDHASWTKSGYRSGMATEGRFSDMNPSIHSPRDVVDNIDFKHAAEFSRLILAFALELAEAH